MFEEGVTIFKALDDLGLVEAYGGIIDFQNFWGKDLDDGLGKNRYWNIRTY